MVTWRKRSVCVGESNHSHLLPEVTSVVWLPDCFRPCQAPLISLRPSTFSVLGARPSARSRAAVYTAGLGGEGSCRTADANRSALSQYASVKLTPNHEMIANVK